MIAALPMMKPLTSSSVQVMETPTDIIGSNARKRRREIIQSNRAAKTSFVIENIPNSPMESKKKMRSGSASTVKVRHTLNASYPSIPPKIQNHENIISNSIRYANLTKLKTIPTTAPLSTANSKMPSYCGSIKEYPTTNAASIINAVPIPNATQIKITTPMKSSKKTKATNKKQAVKGLSISTNTKLPEQPDANSKKKPQMRYDPSVPMTKEAAAVWRREQRRKRNRDSAAASRQRQRNRITELEEEVSEWKKKYGDAMVQLSKQEAETKRLTLLDQNSTTSDCVSELMPQFVPHVSKSTTEDVGINCDTTKPAIVFEDEIYTAVSPCLTPSLTPHPSVVPSDFVSLSLPQALPIGRDPEVSESQPRIKQEEQNEQETFGMTEARKEGNLIEISRPA